MNIQDKVRSFIESNQLLQQGDRVLVGLSGGADSVALLRLLGSLGYECVAVHCNFHLRGEESDRDQKFVERLCAGLGVVLSVVHYDTVEFARERQCSIEMAARELRYNDFERLRAHYDCQAIAVAHHIDDSVETVLMNLVRGTGLRGMTGIRARNGNVIRPLLCLRRYDIENWLREQGHEYVTDSTNLECDYTRNKVRLQLLPLLRQLNPDADGAIHSTSVRLMECFRIYSNAVGRDIERCMSSDGHQRVLDIGRLRQSASVEAVLYEILSPYGYNDSQISDIMESLDGEPGRRFVSDRTVLVKDRDSLILMEKAELGSDAFVVKVEKKDGYAVSLGDGHGMSVRVMPAGTPIVRDRNVAMLDADRLSDSLSLRTWRQGDSFVPFGMKGRRLLSDFMTDLKMSLFQKQNQLVLCDGDNIVWVVGQRIDNRYRVNDDTSSILLLESF